MSRAHDVQQTTLEKGLPLQIQLGQCHLHQRMKTQPGSLPGFVSSCRTRNWRTEGGNTRSNMAEEKCQANGNVEANAKHVFAN